MFGFLSMMRNYEQRKVARWPDNDDWVVDTCYVNDSEKNYETAVKHDRYNGGKMVIVELYDIKQEAQVGHDKWVSLMSAETLPESLNDVSTAEMAKLCDIFDKGKWREKL